MSHRTVVGRLKVYAVGVLALVAGVGVAGAARGGAAAPDTSPAALALSPQNVHVVMEGHVQSGPVISGSLQPERKATVRAEVAGAVLAASVDVGTAVVAGQVIGRIDDLAIRDGYASAQSAVRAADAALTVARRNVQRMEALAAAGAVAERAVEDARTGALAAERQHADARTGLAQAEKLLSQTTVRAPITGVIAERSVSSGDIVQPGMALFTVVDPTSMELEASVPSDQLERVRVGATVQFRVHGYEQSFTGSIARISPVADPVTRQVRVYISLPNRSNRLVGGLFAEGRVATVVRDGIVVPVTAVDIAAGDSTAAVLRVRGGAVERIDVALGLRDERADLIEVLSGVAAGDTLLVGAARTVTPGTPVRVGGEE